MAKLWRSYSKVLAKFMFRPFRKGRKKVCLGSLASPRRREVFEAWQGAIHPFRNTRKDCCGGSQGSFQKIDALAAWLFQGEGDILAIERHANTTARSKNKKSTSKSNRKVGHAGFCWIGKKSNVPHLRWSQAPPCLGQCQAGSADISVYNA